MDGLEGACDINAERKELGEYMPFGDKDHIQESCYKGSMKTSAR